MTFDGPLHAYADPTRQLTLASAQACLTGFAHHSHDSGTGHGNDILCLSACECGKPSLLPLLFTGTDPVTISLTAPGEDDPRSEPSQHPALDIHVCLGDDDEHSLCFMFATCGMCHINIWDTALSTAGGRFGAHLFPSDPEQVNLTDFRFGEWKKTRAAIATVKERHRP